jgi:alpha-beta hydrolase superfamily lysophospholipase
MQKIAIGSIRLKFSIISLFSGKLAARAAFQLFCTPQLRNRKTPPPIFDEAEDLELVHKGNLLRGFRWNKGAEKKVLIVHGFESTVLNFENYIQPLMDKGYEVLAFDAMAHGRSEGKTINILQYQEMLQQIDAVYGPIRSFVAHSFGGLTTTLYLESIVHDNTYRLVLIAPATETTTAIDQFFAIMKLHKGIRREFDRLIENIGGHKPDWFSIRRAAPFLKAQVLFLQDTKDAMTPYSDVIPLMDQKLPNFRFLISEGLGHRRIYRDEKSSKAVIDFL